MKTKIIYISGGEVFDMADIRAAFDEVRTTLGLGADTVMFGVPVDADNALASSEDASAPTVAESIAIPAPTITEDAPAIAVAESAVESPIPDADIAMSVAAEDKNAAEEFPVEKPKKAVAKRGRPRTKVASEEASPEKAPHTDVAPISDNVATSETVATPAEETETPVIPILSVLASNEATPTADVTPTEVIADINIDTELADVADKEIIDDATAPQRVTIEDMITDEVPEAPVEKTLEQLLESMTPLREDIAEETHFDTAAQEETDITLDSADTSEDTDATLAQLATEFAENEDKIVASTKQENHGKIGKLKNILPFKKAKREDNSLMGDLFGWAGIAANDEDFAIPGFFTNAASKK